jgi:hypothetical protein
MAAVLSLMCVASAQALQVYVPAESLWTDTRITLSRGDTVAVTASGTWCWKVEWVGPNGVYDGTVDTFLNDGTHGELIAFVGPDPYQGHWGDGNFFPQAAGYWGIGGSGQFISLTAGELWLGINDDAVTEATSDNSGFVVANISVVPVPEPGAFHLALLGGVLGGYRSIRRRIGG